MKQQLTQYVELLFAGAPHAEDMKQEILQNTLDRYDDLISQGKSPEAAYQLAISGIGDINELLTGISEPKAWEPIYTVPEPKTAREEKERRLRKSAAIAMYILCPVPLIILSEFGLDTLGVCLMLLLVAAATALLIMNGSPEEKEGSHRSKPENPLTKSINTLITVVGLITYFVISFATQAWFITWLIFPIMGAVRGLVRAILDLKEAETYAP